MIIGWIFGEMIFWRDEWSECDQWWIDRLMNERVETLKNCNIEVKNDRKMWNICEQFENVRESSKLDSLTKVSKVWKTSKLNQIESMMNQSKQIWCETMEIQDQQAHSHLPSQSFRFNILCHSSASFHQKSRLSFIMIFPEISPSRSARSTASK
jgi:hypothetical protein